MYEKFLKLCTRANWQLDHARSHQTDIESHRIFIRSQKAWRDELGRGIFKENDPESSKTYIKAETQRFVCEMNNEDSYLEKRGSAFSSTKVRGCVYVWSMYFITNASSQHIAVDASRLTNHRLVLHIWEADLSDQNNKNIRIGELVQMRYSSHLWNVPYTQRSYCSNIQLLEQGESNSKYKEVSSMVEVAGQPNVSWLKFSRYYFLWFNFLV